AGNAHGGKTATRHRRGRELGLRRCRQPLALAAVHVQREHVSLPFTRFGAVNDQGFIDKRRLVLVSLYVSDAPCTLHRELAFDDDEIRRPEIGVWQRDCRMGRQAGQQQACNESFHCTFSIIQGRRSRSALPPVSTTPAVPPSSVTLPSSNAARPTAADGSTTIFRRSNRRRMAAMMAASGTVTIASTCRRMMARFGSPTVARRPSAIVFGRSTGTIFPAWNDAAASAAPSGSTPMTRMPGWRAFAAVAQPAIRPPPPSGTSNTCGGCSSWSSNSTATVPCPAITL